MSRKSQLHFGKIIALVLKGLVVLLLRQKSSVLKLPVHSGFREASSQRGTSSRDVLNVDNLCMPPIPSKPCTSI